MLTLLTGDDTYLIEEQLARITAGPDAGELTLLDGETLSLQGLHQALHGLSLLASTRTIVIRRPAAQPSLWTALAKQAAECPDHTHLVLVAPGVDKRTRAYRQLAAQADTRVYRAPDRRDQATLVAWAQRLAKQQGGNLTATTAAHVVRRTGPDRWAIADAVNKLLLSPQQDAATIDALVPHIPDEAVFDLIEHALQGRADLVAQRLAQARLSTDPYRLFGLVAGQVATVAALGYARAAMAKRSVLAPDLPGVHPFVLKKLHRVSRSLSLARLRQVVDEAALADARLKNSPADPWAVVATFLQTVAHQAAGK